MEKMDYKLVRRYASDMYRYGRNNDGRIINAIINFREEGKKSPSIAELIRQDEFQKSYKRYQAEAFEDISRMAPPFKTMLEFTQKSRNAKENCNSLENLMLLYKSEFGKNFGKLYPKTLRIRRALVKTGKVKMDYVTPKANFFEKLKLKKFFKPLTLKRQKYLDKKFGEVTKEILNKFKSQGKL